LLSVQIVQSKPHLGAAGKRDDSVDAHYADSPALGRSTPEELITSGFAVSCVNLSAVAGKFLFRETAINRD
jgi:hypothetical protein